MSELEDEGLSDIADIVVKNNDVLVKQLETSKAPMPSVGRKLPGQLRFKNNQKVR